MQPQPDRNASQNGRFNSRVDRRLFLAGSAALSAMGCHNFVRRSQSPDELSTSLKNDVQATSAGYISEICRIFGANYSKIEGIGLAFGLAETGSDPKPGGQREHLIRELGGQKLSVDIPTLLAGKDTELVLLKGLIPPAAKAGDRFDVEVGTMRSTDATSIENGMVSKTRMFPIESIGRSVTKGNTLGYCQGRILVDSLFESRQDQANQLHGYILGGGIVIEGREIGLQLASEHASTKRAVGIARAINTRFTYSDKAGRHGIANPKTDRFVSLIVPHEYRNNLGRFLDIVMNIVHSETPNELLERMEDLEQGVIDPARAALSAFRLEAIGKNGVPILKRVLKHDDLEIKFYAAEALAYLGEPDGLPHLRMVAETEPALRWAAITALSTIPGAEAAKALTELLHSSSAETRFGAFQGMQNHSPEDPLVAGQSLGDFTLYRLASTTTQPMLHFSRSKQAEIVVFGDHQTVSEGFYYEAGKVVVQGTMNGHVSISKSTAKGNQRMVVTNQVSDLIQALNKAGFSYGDILKIFRQAKNNGTLGARLVVNAQPRLGRTYVPGQFSDGSTSQNETRDAAKSLSADYNQPVSAKAPAEGEESSTVLSKMKNWFTGKK